MKNEPKKIYLQVGEDCEPDDDFNEAYESGEATWEIDKINDNNLEYWSKEFVLSCIPSNWLDLKLSKEVIDEPPFGCPEIENLLNEIRNELNQTKQ